MSHDNCIKTILSIFFSLYVLPITCAQDKSHAVFVPKELETTCALYPVENVLLAQTYAAVSAKYCTALSSRAELENLYQEYEAQLTQHNKKSTLWHHLARALLLAPVQHAYDAIEKSYHSFSAFINTPLLLQERSFTSRDQENNASPCDYVHQIMSTYTQKYTLITNDLINLDWRKQNSFQESNVQVYTKNSNRLARYAESLKILLLSFKANSLGTHLYTSPLTDIIIIVDEENNERPKKKRRLV